MQIPELTLEDMLMLILSFEGDFVIHIVEEVQDDSGEGEFV